MKAALFDIQGSKKSEIDLPSLFNTIIREDIAAKYFESERFNSAVPYSTFKEAGKRHSASGTISHQRHKWASHYGRGIARLPRKTMSRRGTQFYWIGAEVSGTRGGRVAHPPKGINRQRKINKKEIILALNSGFAATANKDYIVRRYSSINKIEAAPLVIEFLPSKTKDLIPLLKKILGNSFTLALKKKEVRAGKGKRRGRKYKSNAGLLVVIGNNEKSNFKGIDVKRLKDIKITDLYPLGRLTLYTKTAMEEMKNA